MTNEMTIQTVSDELFKNDELNVFAVLDGASIPDLLDQLYEQQPEHVCLYRGELEPDMAEVAPYLVKLDPDSDFTDWLFEKGWGQHWGIFALSNESLSAMRNHFRTFLIVYTPENKPVNFRYYDPRVMRLYLPTCNAKELATVFGPVEEFLLEGEDAKTALRFRDNSGVLQQEKLTPMKE
jgi:Domain of unknown function (DUF4123)